MTLADVSIAVLVGLFVLAGVVPRVHLGLTALPAAFLLGLGAGVPADEVTDFFPANFVVLVVGVMALFGTAHANGTLDWLLESLLRLVGGRLVLVPVVPFVIGAVLTAIGTLPAASVAIVAPIALGLAARYRYSPLIASVVGVTGILSGVMSPFAMYGLATLEMSDELELPASAPVSLFLGGIGMGAAICVAALVVGVWSGAIPRGTVARERVGPGRHAPTSPADSDQGAQPGLGHTGAAGTATRTVPRVARPATRLLTLGAMAVVVVLAVGFDLDIGYLGLTAAVLLHLVLRLDAHTTVTGLPWNVVLLIGGLLTYVGLMEELGAFERLSELLTVQGAPLLSLLGLCYVAGVTSFAASSIAVFVTMMPLLPPLIASGISPVGAVLAVAFSMMLTDINPLGITGGLLLGSAEPAERERLFRHLLVYGLVSVAVAPLVAWAVFGWW
ncbi:di/tricarboxylate transporter [Prauserella isguenensis]|uniref:Di/tricarboxylate transporter n=1 Tax=Prauserella isguenensis TaxID=1470180 RepID=A0A839RV74_9PSEU|nr:SLC13 family permease [Prauserella isguenensis]MBB3049055.1 di/tricarboxylate transporter [Prauserella isguenensis]